MISIIKYVGSKEPITAETYSRPSNEKNDACWLFLVYFLHLVVGNNHIFEPLYPLHNGILLSGVFGGVYGTAYTVWSQSRECPPITKNEAMETNLRRKTIPQMTGSNAANVKSLHIHSEQTIYLTV